MEFGELLKNAAKNFVGKYLESLKKKALIISGSIIAFIVIITGAGGGADSANAAATSNSDGMSDASTSGGGSSTQSGGSTTGVWGNINLYNADGTVNEEKIDELERAFEAEFNLVTASSSGNNIGGRYNPETCKKVTGTYLGWDGVEGGYSTSYTDTVAGCQYKGKNQLGIYQCTWWANGRASEYLGYQVEISKVNGGKVYDDAAGKFARGDIPKPNSLAVYPEIPTEDEPNPPGHVAYVEAVDEVNGYYYISHAGGGRSWFGIQRLRIDEDENEEGIQVEPPWSSYRVVGFVYLDQPIN